MAENSRRDLLIGSNSQLAVYWSKKNTDIISSHDIDINEIKKNSWNRIYIAFSDGRTFLKEWKFFPEMYYVNVVKTFNLIHELKDYCNKIIYFSTTELWNKCEGKININTPFNFDRKSPYINSKYPIASTLLNKREELYKNVIIVYPFSFNCAFRKEGRFLFSKVFDSIINRKQIEIGNTYHYRELLHPIFVMDKVKKANEDEIIGCGRLVHVNDFIRDLYEIFQLKYEDYVIEKIDNNEEKKPIFYLDKNICDYSYQQLLNETVIDIVRIKTMKGKIEEVPYGLLQEY
jgi:nucleoside-diphosphate-sugar epimerase